MYLNPTELSNEAGCSVEGSIQAAREVRKERERSNLAGILRLVLALPPHPTLDGNYQGSHQWEDVYPLEFPETARWCRKALASLGYDVADTTTGEGVHLSFSIGQNPPEALECDVEWPSARAHKDAQVALYNSAFQELCQLLARGYDSVSQDNAHRPYMRQARIEFVQRLLQNGYSVEMEFCNSLKGPGDARIAVINFSPWSKGQSAIGQLDLPEARFSSIEQGRSMELFEKLYLYLLQLAHGRVQREEHDVKACPAGSGDLPVYEAVKELLAQKGIEYSWVVGESYDCKLKD